MRKTLKMKLTAALFCVLLVAGSAISVCAEPFSADYHVETTQAGEFSMNGVRVSYNSFIEAAGENSAYIYDVNGQKVFPEAVRNSNYLERGMFEFGKADASDVNSTALVSADGKVLLPFEYAFYSWPGYNNKTQSRFILAYTGTEVTENTEEALFYTTDAMIAIGGPGKDDVMYKGYAKIFDIEKEKFVENLQFEHIDKYDTINIVGNSILIQNEDSTHTLYDADGKKLMDLKEKVDTNGSCIITKDSSGYGSIVYDETGKEVSRYETSARTFDSTSDYIQVYTDRKYKVMDLTGKQVLDIPLDIIYDEDHGIYRTKVENSNIIYDASGKKLGETEGDYTYLGYGHYALETGVKTYTLTGISGAITEEVKEEGYVYTKDEKIICYNDGSGFLPYDSNASYHVLGDSILCVEPGSDGQTALYDLFTGKQILSELTDVKYVRELIPGRIVVELSDNTFKTYDVTVKEGN